VRIDHSLPCSKQSIVSGEPIAGTATAGVEVWLLIEQRDRWEADVTRGHLPPTIEARVDELSRDHPALRLQLLRRPGATGSLLAYVVTTGAVAAVHRFEIERHEDLLEVDLDALVRGELTSVSGTRPLYLVCTHGRRDRCCAMYGLPFYRALSEMDLDAEVWQSSHQGGHRFAACVLYLPDGLHYGRLDPVEAEALVHAHARGELYLLNRYRGQTRFAAHVQAAESWLREQEQILAIDGLTLIDHGPLAGGRFAARFRIGDGTLHSLTVEPRRGRLARLASCGAEQAEVPRWFEVVRHEARTSRGPESSPEGALG
jgi:hypothetical protein